MHKKKLILLSSSQKRSADPRPLSPLERYQGVFFQITNKYIREGMLRNTEVVVVSEKYGVLRADDKVPYDPPYQAELSLSNDQLRDANERNLVTLGNIFRQNHYDEVLVVCGRPYQKLIMGFEDLTAAKVVLLEGRSLGPKAQNLKRWIFGTYEPISSKHQGQSHGDTVTSTVANGPRAG
jgi:hypothetical protein